MWFWYLTMNCSRLCVSQLYSHIMRDDITTSWLVLINHMYSLQEYTYIPFNPLHVCVPIIFTMLPQSVRVLLAGLPVAPHHTCLGWVITQLIFSLLARELSPVHTTTSTIIDVIYKCLRLLPNKSKKCYLNFQWYHKSIMINPVLNISCVTGSSWHQLDFSVSDKSQHKLHQIWLISEFNLFKPGPVFCLLLGVSSGYARPNTGQVTSVTWSVIGWA